MFSVFFDVNMDCLLLKSVSVILILKLTCFLGNFISFNTTLRVVFFSFMRYS